MVVAAALVAVFLGAAALVVAALVAGVFLAGAALAAGFFVAAGFFAVAVVALDVVFLAGVFDVDALTGWFCIRPGQSFRHHPGHTSCDALTSLPASALGTLGASLTLPEGPEREQISISNKERELRRHDGAVSAERESHGPFGSTKMPLTSPVVMARAI